MPWSRARPPSATSSSGTGLSEHDNAIDAFPNKLPSLEYPSHFEQRLVSRNGGIRWRSNWVNVSHTLAGQYVDLEEIDDALWTVYLGPMELGRLHERELVIEDTLGRRSRNVSPMSLG